MDEVTPRPFATFGWDTRSWSVAGPLVVMLPTHRDPKQLWLPLGTVFVFPRERRPMGELSIEEQHERWRNKRGKKSSKWARLPDKFRRMYDDKCVPQYELPFREHLEVFQHQYVNFSHWDTVSSKNSQGKDVTELPLVSCGSSVRLEEMLAWARENCWRPYMVWNKRDYVIAFASAEEAMMATMKFCQQ